MYLIEIIKPNGIRKLSPNNNKIEKTKIVIPIVTKAYLRNLNLIFKFIYFKKREDYSSL